MMLTADEMRKSLPFKGKFIMYYKDGKNLFFKTTEFLYRVVLAKSGRVILKVFRKYNVMKKADNVMKKAVRNV